MGTTPQNKVPSRIRVYVDFIKLSTVLILHPKQKPGAFCESFHHKYSTLDQSRVTVIFPESREVSTPISKAHPPLFTYDPHKALLEVKIYLRFLKYISNCWGRTRWPRFGFAYSYLVPPDCRFSVLEAETLCLVLMLVACSVRLSWASYLRLDFSAPFVTPLKAPRALGNILGWSVQRITYSTYGQLYTVWLIVSLDIYHNKVGIIVVLEN